MSRFEVLERFFVKGVSLPVARLGWVELQDGNSLTEAAKALMGVVPDLAKAVDVNMYRNDETAPKGFRCYICERKGDSVLYLLEWPAEGVES